MYKGLARLASRLQNTCSACFVWTSERVDKRNVKKQQGVLAYHKWHQAS